MTDTSNATLTVDSVGERTGQVYARAMARNARFPSDAHMEAEIKAKMAHDYAVEASGLRHDEADRQRVLALAVQFADRAEALLKAEAQAN